ncbi:hypothetical protein MUO14_22350 [Halobacillus shinanisalinarum]|uniref:Uncharacterized protein n=1 Tax=Halobacillus shinanisalinarum TaxID=2932258 RepID=A0ABY4GY20_9BACI|nr:hypothetical protein [Halobacillus shinanisalinarum]UOQ93100.1 hypothetical protein MUO14_22350 [Halobacillus shinanisalinarum]
MRTITLEKIDNNINENRTRANAIIRTSSRTLCRKKKSRTRTPGEVKALNEISIARWQKAVRAGKVKKLGKRSMYYDYS